MKGHGFQPCRSPHYQELSSRAARGSVATERVATDLCFPAITSWTVLPTARFFGAKAPQNDNNKSNDRHAFHRLGRNSSPYQKSRDSSGLKPLGMTGMRVMTLFGTPEGVPLHLSLLFPCSTGSARRLKPRLFESASYATRRGPTSSTLPSPPARPRVSPTPSTSRRNWRHSGSRAGTSARTRSGWSVRRCGNKQ